MNTVIDYEDIKINLHLTSILFGGTVTGELHLFCMQIKNKANKEMQF